MKFKNTIKMLMADYYASDIPMFYMDMWVVLVFQHIYVAFTFIYIYTGQLNMYGQNFIYYVMDPKGDPIGFAIIYGMGFISCVLFFSLLTYGKKLIIKERDEIYGSLE